MEQTENVGKSLGSSGVCVASGQTGCLAHCILSARRAQAKGEIPALAAAGDLARYIMTVVTGMTVAARSGATVEKPVADLSISLLVGRPSLFSRVPLLLRREVLGVAREP